MSAVTAAPTAATSPTFAPAAGAAALRAASVARATASRPDDSGRTLEAVIAGTWEGLTIARRAVACPVCGGQMSPRYGASGPAPVGGRCSDCGTTLG